MHNFVFVGFNVRQWPWAGPYNVDDTGWDLNEDVNGDLSLKFDIKENEYQLLMPKNNSEMEKVSRYISTFPKANIAAISIPEFIAKKNDTRTGYKTSLNRINLDEYIFRGFDVCDMDGFFSGLHYPEMRRHDSTLFLPDDYCAALEYAIYMNFIDRDHSPYSVAKIHTLK